MYKISATKWTDCVNRKVLHCRQDVRSTVIYFRHETVVWFAIQQTRPTADETHSVQRTPIIKTVNNNNNQHLSDCSGDAQLFLEISKPLKKNKKQNKTIFCGPFLKIYIFSRIKRVWGQRATDGVRKSKSNMKLTLHCSFWSFHGIC